MGRHRFVMVAVASVALWIAAASSPTGHTLVAFLKTL